MPQYAAVDAVRRSALHPGRANRATGRNTVSHQLSVVYGKQIMAGRRGGPKGPRYFPRYPLGRDIQRHGFVAGRPGATPECGGRLRMAVGPLSAGLAHDIGPPGIYASESLG